ncbi:MAG: selenium-dependent xanthine dehydrogenase [Acidobacteria bacterium]|nr:selenium-dependent xanthine dehydrogenase [Acidobacteriota bacterium]
MPVEFVLNGQPRKIETREGESLLDALRNRCGIYSTKDGCQPQGQCGCCLVLMNARPQLTCCIPATRAQGAEIVTLEGLDDEERKILADSFVAAAGLQCGFCIPGFAMRAKHITDQNRRPTRDEIAHALDVHLCRCTGYVKIIDAIELVARAKRGEGLPEPCEDARVGARLRKFTGSELTLGDQKFVDDMTLPGMLHGALVLSPHARAKVVKIDVSSAEAHSGVVRVATAKDVRGNRWYGLLHNDWPGIVAEGEEVRCVGDIVAVVAAEDRATARAAARLVAVEYELLTPVLDPFDAMKEGAPQVNPDYPNILSKTIVKRGDADTALTASAHVVSGTWKTQRIEHLYLEPESALVEPIENGRFRLFSQGQGIFDDRRQVASFLGVSEDAVHAVLVPNGGAFGGKEDMSVQSQTALMCQLTGRPVKITLSREESIRIHPKRHPITMEYTVGCDAEGRLTAVKARMVGDTGAYASVGSKVLERAGGHSCGPYRVPDVDVEALAVATNNPPCGAMRGFGAPQAHFAMDGCLDMLAEKVGIDGWEIRWRNVVDVGDLFSTGQVFEKSVGIRKTLLAVRDRYYAERAAGRAVGIGCGIKNSGIGNGAKEWGRVRLVVENDETVSLYNGYTEMGQGLLTVLVQCAVEVTGLPHTSFHPKVDSTFELGCGQTTGSRATLFGGRAVIDAAEKLRIDLVVHGSLAALSGKVYAGEVLIDDTTAPSTRTDRIKTHTAYGFATQLCILDEEGRLDTFVAAHDVGRAINPALCEGQVEGSIHMGLGYALTEDLPCPDGMPQSFRLRDIGALRARHMPKTEVILVEESEPEGPFGAKGVGEIGLVPTAAAVAGALHAFDGIRRFELPMRESPAARALGIGLRASTPAREKADAR